MVLFERWCFSQIRAQFVADTPEHCQAFLVSSVEGGGIVETVMETLGRAAEHGARFPGVVADGDDVVEVLALEFIDVL